nr:polyadenylate-binding protein 2-like [Tanacetum cinerariifolium]
MNSGFERYFPFVQGGFDYQQQLVPGMRLGGDPMPNFFVPVIQQGQRGQQLGGRRGIGPMQQNQQSVLMIQQQVFREKRVVSLEKASKSQADIDATGEPIARGPWYNASLAVTYKRHSVSCT